MRTVIIALSLIFFLVQGSFAHKVNLRDGDAISSGEMSYRKGEFKLDGETIDRDEVKKVILGDLKETSTGEKDEYKLTGDKIQEWRDLAEKMEAEYPAANGLIFLDYGIHSLTSDGREIYEYHFTGKVLSQESKWWAQLAWYIDEGINRVKVLYARGIAPDGTITNYSPDDITYSEPTRGAVFFGQGKSMSLNIPGVEIGSIVDFGYIIETYAPEDPELFQPRFYFQSSEPAYISRAVFEVPLDRDLHYEPVLMSSDDKLVGFGVERIPDFEGSPEPEITETDSSRKYTWELKNIEPRISEPNSMGYYSTNPGVFGALYEDYSYYNKRFGDLHKEHMKLTPTLDSLANAIVGDAQDDKEKIAKLYHWVQRNIRYISVKGALASRFGGHYAEITYDNQYGDCSDKAVFFATLLKAVGVEAYPIIVMTNDASFIDRDRFPFWGGNHAINEVWWDGEPHVLDATNNLFRFPYYSMGDCDLYYANYVRGEIVYNPPIAPPDNSMNSQTLVKLDSEGKATIQDSFYYTGTMEAMYRGWFQYTPEIQHGKVVEQFLASRKAGATLDDFRIHNVDDISVPFGLVFMYDVKDYWTPAGDYYLLDVPALGYRYPEIALTDRNYGIKLDMTYQRTHDVTFELPEGYRAEFIPEKIDLSNDYLEYHASYERDGSKIIFKDKYWVKKLRIPVSDYEIYKADAEKVLAYLKEKIFLVRD